jgi:uncharacterized protein with FMN-binding domain
MKTGHANAMFALIGAVVFLYTGCAATGVITADDISDNLAVRPDSFRSIPDGTYTGTGTTGVPSGSIAVMNKVSVSVRIAGGTVQDITITAPDELDTVSDFTTLKKSIIDAESLDVDVISGATYSSIAYIKAIEKAVFK